MAEITAKLVKELRDKTSAGMMDCKKALIENKGDMDKSIEWLRQKGIASAEKKSGRVAAEGAVGSYIHTGSRVGVLLELNCETDFVARGDLFQGLLRDLSMQVAACPSVEYVSVDQIPESIANKEKEIEMGRDDLSGKPDQIKAKIVEGRIAKRLKEMALLEQPFIKDSSINVEELVKQVAGKIGENIRVRRFTRYILGGFNGSLSGQVTLISPQVRQRRVLSTDPTGDADSRVVEVRVKLDNSSAKKVSHLTGMKVIARFQP